MYSRGLYLFLCWSFVCCTAAQAQDTTAPSGNSTDLRWPPDKQMSTVLITPHGPITTTKVKKEHYIGLGPKRSGALIAFPAFHPVKFFNKATFPVRHPLAFTHEFGEKVLPYQNAANFVSAVSGPLSAIGIFTRIK